LTDNGKEFIATVVVDLIKESNPNCYLVTGRPRTPRDQGSVENANKMVQQVLKSISSENRLRSKEVNWTKLLGQVMSVCNSHSGIRKNSVSSYVAVFGQKYHQQLQCNLSPAIDLAVSNSQNVAAIAPIDLTVSPPHSNQTYCQLTFDSPQPVVVIEESTEQETYRASEFSTFTVQEAWDKGNIARYYQTLSSRQEFKFLWPRLTCMECTFPHHKPFIQIGDEDYMASITQTTNWYDGVFIASFSQLAAHYAHITKDERSTTIPSQVNLPLLIHITYPNEFLQEGQYKSIPPDITRVVAVVHDRDHYGVLEIDIPSKKVIIYDGLYRDLDKWVDYVFSALKRCMLCDLRITHLYAPDEPKLMTLGRSRHAKMSIEGYRLTLGIEDYWRFERGHFIKQLDSFNCGPIACMKILESFI